LELRGERTAQDVLQETTAKGTTYELRVTQTLSEWARHTGARIAHVGSDNKPGDIVIELDDSLGDPVCIVVKARDRSSALGRKGVADCLEKAMSERGCSAAVYVSQSVAGLTNEIGEWAEGTAADGEFVATRRASRDRCPVPPRQGRISRMKEAQRQVDEAAMQTQLARIKTVLTRIATIKRRVGEVKTSVGAIASESEALRYSCSRKPSVVRHRRTGVDDGQLMTRISVVTQARASYGQT
jgi:hypothetical protein